MRIPRIKIPPITIMVIPHSGRRTRSFYIPPLLIVLCAALVVVSAVATGFVIRDYRYARTHAAQVEELRAALDAQERVIGNLRDKASALEAQLNGLDALSSEVFSFLSDQVTADAGLMKYLSPESRSLLKRQDGQTYRGSFERTERVPPGGPPDPVSFVAADTEKMLSQLRNRADELSDKMGSAIAALKETVPYLRSCPSTWPVRGEITSRFGYRRSPFTGAREFHAALDIATGTGESIIAAADGKVVFAGWQAGFGRVVRIDHGYGFSTMYAHLQSIKVKPGEIVKRGQRIGLSGSTGLATGPHLHFAVFVNGVPVDPLKYLSKQGGTVTTASIKP